MIEHPGKNCNLIGLLMSSVQKMLPFAAWKNCFYFLQYSGGRTSEFIVVYDAPVSKKAATLTGRAYFVGRTCIEMIGDGCIVLIAAMW